MPMPSVSTVFGCVAFKKGEKLDQVDSVVAVVVLWVAEGIACLVNQGPDDEGFETLLAGVGGHANYSKPASGLMTRRPPWSCPGLMSSECTAF